MCPMKCIVLSVAQSVGRSIPLLFHVRGNRRGEWSVARPSRTLPPGKTLYRFYRRLGGPQGWSGRAEYLFNTGTRFLSVQSGPLYIYILLSQHHVYSDASGI